MSNIITTNIPNYSPIPLISYYEQYRSYYPNCEMETKKWFVNNAQPDWIYLDCGANIGYYSILFSRLSPKGYIYAFEPTSTISMLKDNLEYNNTQNVEPIHLALGKKNGNINDKIYRIWGKDPEENLYEFTTIDFFVESKSLKKIDCIKIDVDSFDFEVLQGAKNTLIRHNPFVMVELNHALSKRGQSTVEALEWLASMGYENVIFFEHENCLLKKGINTNQTSYNKIEVYFSDKNAKNQHHNNIDDEISRGEILFKSGKIKLAQSLFEDLNINFPDNKKILNNLGVIYYNIEEKNKACNILKKGLNIYPFDDDLRYNLALVLTDLGHHTEAINICKENSNINFKIRAEKIISLIDSKNIHETLKFRLVSLKELHTEFGFDKPIIEPQSNIYHPLDQWKMEINDAPIFRYLYRNFQPHRHLEFGTWQGAGVVYCLEECDATVWTLNLPFGETQPEGGTIYSGKGDSFGLGTSLADAWAQKLGLPAQEAYRTDSVGFIGRFYLEKQLSNRVCQIYCDSTQWDISNYPKDFFDSVLIDGGHVPDVVLSDTKKALSLLRPGGLIMWHDFCPPVRSKFAVVQGVMEGLERAAPLLRDSLEKLFWIEPSWILVGIKKRA